MVIMTKNVIRVKNLIDQAIEKSGLKEGAVRAKFTEKTGVKMSYHTLYSIRKNRRQVTLLEVVCLAEVLDINDFRELLVRKK